MLKYVGILILSLLSVAVHAESYTTTSDLKVTSVFAGYENNGAFFEVDGDAGSSASCSNGAIAVDPARSNVNHVLSVLLYANATGKSVDLQLYNASCLDGHKVLRRIKVTN